MNRRAPIAHAGPAACLAPAGMQSAFSDVALDRLRYSLVWEDSAAMYDSLDIGPADRVLLITSAGCNALNALLKQPTEVVAIDLNPVQNRLLALKKHLIQHHDYAVYSALMGVKGPSAVAESVPMLAATLPNDGYAYWCSFFNIHPQGILTAGKLEAYITAFLATLDADTQQHLRQLCIFDDVVEQWAYFGQTLHNGPFQQQFIHYFDQANLSQGRDPALFNYAQESGGTAFYQRLRRQVSGSLVQHNFFFRFFFFGPQHLPTALLPPCYRPEHFATLRAQLPRLTLVPGEAIDYLLSDAGQTIGKASLSNIFEYTSQAEFRRICRLLATRPGLPLRFVFWNLLQQQGAFLTNDGWTNLPVDARRVLATGCFYFQNLHAVVATPPNSRP